jgi:hypothetical protein
MDLPHLTQIERRFLKEWHEYYIPMLKFIKDVAVKGIRVSPMIEPHLEHLPKYPPPFFISYGSDERLRSFEVLTRGIHEIWITLRILKEFVKEIDFVWFQQSSARPVITLCGMNLTLRRTQCVKVFYEITVEVLMWRGVISLYYSGFYRYGQELK